MLQKADLERLADTGIGAWNDHDADAFLAILADDFEVRDWTASEPMRTRDEVRRYVESWFTAFPDLTVRHTMKVVGDDAVAGELEFSGTNTGVLVMGGVKLPPTNRKVTGHGTYIARVAGDKVVDFRAHPDNAGLMVQLGLIPLPSSQAA